ncbi:receptor-like protein 12 [Salvia splendens]|uniref:receptor-like protein 12 n=1 Tax=Salvia splendens TaxID=180675 RepID=UPI001C26BFB6|nr:receptor-like protein 12 [Salvia splendens]
MVSFYSAYVTISWFLLFLGPIQSTFGNLSNLYALSLSNNNLNGPIPTSIANLSNIYLLFLSSNGLIGELPSSIYNLTSLKYLILSNNNLSETIFVYIHGHIHSNQFSGPIPSTFSQGCSLVSINLSGNKLEGRLPKSLVNCKSLQGLPELRVLVLRSNKFDGNITLPSRFELPFPELQVLDISRNAFVGTLPERYVESNDRSEQGKCNRKIL